jgi:hypothetical protein
MKVSIPVRADSFAVRFPNKCMFDGEPREVGHLRSIEIRRELEGENVKTEIRLMLPSTQKQEQVFVKYSRFSSAFAYISLVAFIIGFIYGLTDPFSAPGFYSMLCLSLLQGASAVALIFLLCYLPTRFFLNRFARRRHESPFDPTLGVHTVYDFKAKAVVFTFQNEAVGREFKALNTIIQVHNPDQQKESFHCPVCEGEISAITEEILAASQAAGPDEDLQAVCFHCKMHIPKFDLMKEFRVDKGSEVFSPLNGSYTDWVYHHIKNVPKEMCWYCETRPVRADQGLEVQMYGNVVMVGEGHQVMPVNWGTKTFFIPRCAECAKDKFHKYTHLNHHPAIQVMKAKGWVVGEKPPGAD